MFSPLALQTQLGLILSKMLIGIGLCSERTYSLVVTKASVAPEVLGSTLHENEYSLILRRCAFSGTQRSHRGRGFAGSAFENARRSKVCVRVFIGM